MNEDDCECIQEAVSANVKVSLWRTRMLPHYPPSYVTNPQRYVTVMRSGEKVFKGCKVEELIELEADILREVLEADFDQLCRFLCYIGEWGFYCSSFSQLLFSKQFVSKHREALLDLDNVNRTLEGNKLLIPVRSFQLPTGSAVISWSLAKSSVSWHNQDENDEEMLKYIRDFLAGL